MVTHGGDAADGALLDAEDHLVEHPFFRRHAGHAIGDTEPEVDDCIREELEGGAAGDDLPRIKGHRRQARPRDADLATERRVVIEVHRLPLIGDNHHGIDQIARYVHLASIDACPLQRAVSPGR